MARMIAVTFALENESYDFVRCLKGAQRVRRGVGSQVRGDLGATPLQVWHVGVGRASAREQGRKLLEDARPSMVVCAGYAGALEYGIALGEVVVDWRKQRRPDGFKLSSGWREGRVVTVETVAETSAAKEKLGKESGAIAVDMETGVLAEIFEASGVPLIAVRSISDRVDDELPVPMDRWFDLQRQRPRPLALLTYLASHPGRIGPFFRFVRNLAPARRNLAAALVELIPHLKGS